MPGTKRKRLRYPRRQERLAINLPSGQFLALDPTDALSIPLPGLSLYAFQSRFGRRFSNSRRRFLGRLVWLASNGRLRPHRLREGASSIEARWLDAQLSLGTNTGNTRREMMELIFTIEPLSSASIDYQSSTFGGPRNRAVVTRGAGTTDAYTLKPEVALAFRQVAQEVFPVVDLKESPSQPVDIQDSNSLGLPLPAVVPLSLSRIATARHSVVSVMIHERGGNGQAALDTRKVDMKDAMSVVDALCYLDTVEQWTRSTGGLPMHYVEQASGRLGPDKGDLSDFHICRMPKVIRELLFVGHYDYDIRACYYSILQALGRAYNVDTPAIDGYLRHRGAQHAFLSEQLGVREHVIKEVLNGLTMGLRLDSVEWSTLSGILGSSDTAEKLLAFPVVSRLKEDVQSVMKEARTRHPMANALGKPLVGDRDTILLQGYEQLAIRAMCRAATGLTAIVYDGFLTAIPQDVAALEAAARSECVKVLGFDLRLTLKEKAL